MKKLLSFSINDYPGSQNDLQGCVNDSINIVSQLNGQSDFGFESKVFYNSEVTRELFRDELTKLVLSAKCGDIIVISYSGHGTFLPDISGDELDGSDEALYLSDGVFLDDEFNSILADLEEGVECVFIMDCCFSGTITRDIMKKSRFKPFFVEVDSEGHPIEKKRFLFRKREVNPLMNHVVLTGSSDKETSADALIGGVWNGAMTYYAMKTLSPGISYKEWHKDLLKKIKANGYSQTPQLAGPDYLLSRGVFGSVLTKRKCFLARWFNF
jgi:hypothetical protein